jgi:hypothetical protein
MALSNATGTVGRSLKASGPGLRAAEDRAVVGWEESSRPVLLAGLRPVIRLRQAGDADARAVVSPGMSC